MINNENCPRLKQLEFDRYDNKLSTLISNLETEKLHHNSTYLIVEDFYIDLGRYLMKLCLMYHFRFFAFTTLLYQLTKFQRGQGYFENCLNLNRGSSFKLSQQFYSITQDILTIFSPMLMVF